jgi:hypothetical protein
MTACPLFLHHPAPEGSDDVAVPVTDEHGGMVFGRLSLPWP